MREETRRGRRREGEKEVRKGKKEQGADHAVGRISLPVAVAVLGWSLFHER